MKPSQQEFLRLHQKGYERASNGDWAAANEAYEQALAMMEDGVEYQTATAVRANLGQNYAHLGDLERAWPHTDAAVAAVRDIDNIQMRGQVMNQLAWFLYEHGSTDRLPEALQLADEALQHIAASLRMAAMDTKMRILIKLGREADAKRIAREALAADPDHADFQDVKQRWRLDQPDVDSPPPLGGLTPIPY